MFGIDSRNKFGRHVSGLTGRTDGRMTLLGHLMPNIGGLSSGRRDVICRVVHSIGVMVWSAEDTKIEELASKNTTKGLESDSRYG